MVKEQHLESSLDKIRVDHLARYYKAAKICSGVVIDAACGCGYGSSILSKSENIQTVIGLDINEVCIDYANKHWNDSKIQYVQQDLQEYNLGIEADWLVSFETIEHMPNPELFLKKVSAKNIICSVPNEHVFKYDKKKHIYHYRHYRTDDIHKLLIDCGYTINKTYYQLHQLSEDFIKNQGRTIIVEASKI